MKKIHTLILIIFFFLFISQLNAQNIMKLSDVSIQAGQEVTVNVSIDNVVPFVAFQADITIPTGLTYIESSTLLDDARKDGHLLSASIVNTNTLRLIGFSLSNIPFKGNSGAVMHFKLKAGSQPGNYPLTLNNPIIGDETSANILTSSVNGTVTIQSPHIQLSSSSIDFGRVALGQTQDQYVTINNTGNQTLNITGITFTNSQFTVVGGSTFTIAPNSSNGINVRFTSQTKGNYTNEVMSVASNDPALPKANIYLQSVAFAVNEIHTGNLTALSGQTKTLDFTINNMEPFTAFQFDIPLPSTMQYVAGSAILLRNQNHQVSSNLIAGNTLRVVAFSASNASFTGADGKVLSLDFKIVGQAGWYPINVTNGIISDVAGLNSMSASYNGSLQVAAAQISTSQQFDFGDVSILSSKTQNLRVYNYGGDVLTIDQLKFSDLSFTSSQSLPLIIPIGNFADIPVTFSKNTKGLKSATLKIYSNDPITNPFTVNLSANAFAPNYISVKDFNGYVGTDVVVTIDVENEEEFVALQCDLKYPEYITPKTSSIVLTDRKGDHIIQSSQIGNNTIRLVAFSFTQQIFSGKTGAVIQIPFTIKPDAVTGTYPLEISNGILGNSASQNILKSSNNGTITIKAGPPESKLQLSVFLEGAYNGTGLMNTTLKSNNLIPLLQPYRVAPWNYAGTESVSAIPAGVVDWVLVEVRQAASAALATQSTILTKRAAFLKSDGTIVDLDGTSLLNIGNPIITNSLYVVVRHRNHLAIMSSTGAVLNNNIYAFDFTTGVSQAFGGVAGYKLLGSGVNTKAVMVAGDIDAEGSIFGSDFAKWATISGTTGVYNSSDLDFDGNIFGSDFAKWAINSGTTNPITKSSNVVTGSDNKSSTYSSQVPESNINNQ